MQDGCAAVAYDGITKLREWPALEEGKEGRLKLSVMETLEDKEVSTYRAMCNVQQDHERDLKHSYLILEVSTRLGFVLLLIFYSLLCSSDMT